MERAVVFVDRPGELAPALAALEGAGRLAVDLESNGLHAFRPRLCTVQLASETRVVLLDTLGLGDAAIAPLATLLSARAGVRKIVHDVAFDARLLAEHGVVLGDVFDTAIAARFLGIAATGLGSLVGSLLGATIDKSLQHHDWAARPIGAAERDYLARDVAHLHALADALGAQIDGHAAADDVRDAIEVETRHRLESAQRLDDEPEATTRPAWAKLVEKERLPPRMASLVFALGTLAESIAEREDRPTFKVAGPDALLGLARRAESLVAAGEGASLRGIPGLSPTMLRHRREVLVALADGLARADVPEEQRARWLVPPPRPPRAEIEARRSREQALTHERKKLAKARGVDEQVVLPGHCLRRISSDDALATAAREGQLEEARALLGRVDGFGARRLANDGQLWIGCLAKVR
jgi:ribonuclease D